MRTQEKVFENPSLFFDDIIREIRLSQESIEMEYYIFSLDSLGEKILKELQKAAFRGVHVRLMVDGIGSSQLTESHVRALNKKKIHTRVFSPIEGVLKRLFGLLFRFHLGLFAQVWINLNRRNHRKICIVDQKKVWCGSLNVSVKHKNWRETGVCFESETEAKYLRKTFDRIWSASRRFRTPGISGESPDMRVNLTLRQRREVYAEWISLILFARERVWIVNPYFIPEYSFIRALKFVSRRKIDVRIILPEKSDVAFYPHVSAVFYEQLIRAGVQLFELSGITLHSKVRIVDDEVWVGSSNLNSRSLLHDLELDVRLTTGECKRRVINSFLRDQDDCQKINLRKLKSRPFRFKIFGWMSLIVRYWL